MKAEDIYTKMLDELEYSDDEVIQVFLEFIDEHDLVEALNDYVSCNEGER